MLAHDILEICPVGKQDRKQPKDEPPERDFVQFRADPDWIQRVKEVAEHLGLSMSAYIRLAVNERLKRDEAD